MNTRTLATATGIALLALSLTACSSDSTAVDSATSAVETQAAPESTTSAEPSTSAASKPAATAKTVSGSYIALDAFEASKASFASGNVVLFFNASWCPTCQEAEKNLNASGVPDGLTIVKVDYDSNRDLRQKYGVTVQHTFVQVDPDGNQLAKWTGSNTAEAIQGKTV